MADVLIESRSSVRFENFIIETEKYMLNDSTADSTKIPTIKVKILTIFFILVIMHPTISKYLQKDTKFIVYFNKILYN